MQINTLKFKDLHHFSICCTVQKLMHFQGNYQKPLTIYFVVLTKQMTMTQEIKETNIR